MRAARSVLSSRLDEQVGADVEEIGEFAGMRFADGALAVDDFGGNALGAEDLPQVLLGQLAGLHQMEQCLARAGFADRVAAGFVLIDQNGQKPGKLLFLGRRIFAFVETQQFSGQAVALFVGWMTRGSVRPSPWRKRFSLDWIICAAYLWLNDC